MDCGGWRGLDFFKFHGGEKSLILSAKHYMILSVAGVSYSVQVIFSGCMKNRLHAPPVPTQLHIEMVL